MSLGRTLKLLVVTCHPADAFDSAAGTLARHAKMGHQVEIVSLTHGARSHAPAIYHANQQSLNDKSEKELYQQTIEAKKAEFEAAADAVGAYKTHFLGENDEPFVPTRETILRLAQVFREIRPHILMTHHPTERNHHDHPVAGDVSLRAVITASRWLEGSRLEPYLTPTIYFYGLQSRRDATVIDAALRLPATHVVDITDVIDAKKAALASFVSQEYQSTSYASDEYMNRRIEALEGYWGLINASRYAEEFIARQPHQSKYLPTIDELN